MFQKFCLFFEQIIEILNFFNVFLNFLSVIKSNVNVIKKKIKKHFY